MALEPIIQELVKLLLKTCKKKNEIKGLLEKANEQAPKDLFKEVNKPFNFLSSTPISLLSVGVFIDAIEGYFSAIFACDGD